MALLRLDVEVRATYKVMISLFLFPTYWISVAAIAATFFGWGVGAPLLIVFPISGYIGLLMVERFTSLVSETRAYLVLRGRRSLARSLRGRRETLLDGIERLVELYDSTDRE